MLTLLVYMGGVIQNQSSAFCNKYNWTNIFSNIYFLKTKLFTVWSTWKNPVLWAYVTGRPMAPSLFSLFFSLLFFYEKSTFGLSNVIESWMRQKMLKMRYYHAAQVTRGNDLCFLFPFMIENIFIIFIFLSC